MNASYNEDAENSVVASMVYNTSTIPEIRTIVSESDFFSEKNCILFAAILDLHEKKHPVDAVTIASHIGKDGIEKCGGVMVLANIIKDVATSQAGSHYAKIVKECSTRRAVGSLLDVANKQVSNDTVENGAILSGIRQGVSNIIDSQCSDNDVISIKETIGDTYNQLTRTEPVEGLISTGILRIDSEFGGLWPGHMTVIGGRPSMGKSAFVANIILNAAKAGKKVTWMSLEDTRFFCEARMISRIGGISLARMLSKQLDSSEHKRMVEAVNTLSKLPISILDRAGRTTDDLHAAALRQQDRHGLDLLVIDHTHQIRGGGENPYQRISNNAHDVGEIFKSLNVAGILLHQLNRDLERRDNKQPTMADLRESGRMEEIARVIMLMFRPWYYDKNMDENELACICVKASHGRPGTYQLFCDLQRMYIGDPPTEGY